MLFFAVEKEEFVLSLLIFEAFPQADVFVVVEGFLAEFFVLGLIFQDFFDFWFDSIVIVLGFAYEV